MITNADFAPTMLEMAGIDTPSDMQGRSFLPILQDSVPNDWPEVVYYHYWQHILHRDVAAHYGVRTRDKKLIFYYGLPLGLTEYDPTPPEWELFDLSKDPGEMNNVYDDPEYSDVRKELKVQLLDLQDKLDDRGKEYPDLIEMQQKEFSDVL